MHGAQCPSCGIVTVSFNKQLMRGLGWEPYPCQGCGLVVAKSLRAVIPGLIPVIGLVPLIIGFIWAIDAYDGHCSIITYLRMALVVSLYLGLVMLSYFFVWRFLPLRVIAENTDAARESYRPSLADSATKALLPASVFGLFGLVFARSGEAVLASVLLFLVIWMLGVGIKVSGRISGARSGSTKVSGWLVSAVSGGMLFAWYATQFESALIMAVAWPLLMVAGWWSTREKK